LNNKRKRKGLTFSKLKGARIEKGLTMKEAGKIAGCNEGSYCAKENGIRDWKSTEMANLRKYFDMPADVLFRELFYN